MLDAIRNRYRMAETLHRRVSGRATGASRARSGCAERAEFAFQNYRVLLPMKVRELDLRDG